MRLEEPSLPVCECWQQLRGSGESRLRRGNATFLRCEVQDVADDARVSEASLQVGRPQSGCSFDYPELEARSASVEDAIQQATPHYGRDTWCLSSACQATLQPPY